MKLLWPRAGRGALFLIPFSAFRRVHAASPGRTCLIRFATAGVAASESLPQ